MLSQLPEMPVYSQLPITLVSGRGVFVTDDKGNEYLDMYGGHAVAVTGHCHPRVVEAVSTQAGKLLFYSNAVGIEIRSGLCKRLIELGPENMKAVFLCNSGAEANENALTLARLATGRRKIVSVTGGFHGRTLLTLSISGLENYRHLTETHAGPLFQHCQVAAFGDLDDVRKIVDETCAALIIEPVQGLNGAVVATDEFLEGIREICDATGAMMIFDEVQCGSGRCGAFTAAQTTTVLPDMVTLAKGLAGGFPIGAVMADERSLTGIKSGSLGSTFGGGPLACAAAVANLEVMVEEDLFKNAEEVGGHLMTRLSDLPGVQRVQGKGLLIGIVLDRPAAPVRDRLLFEHSIITGTSAVPDILRLLPPLNLKKGEADRFLDALKTVLTEE
jgi:acetylornithine/N-succinyldiaminopimelate aminotransferase